MPSAKAASTALVFLLAVTGLPGALPVALAGGDATTVEDTASAARRFGAGYKRGAGLGNLGASLVVPATPRLSLDLHLAAFHPEGARGLALAPAIRARLHGGDRSSAYVTAGPQYVRLSFGGDAIGSGLGWSFTAGHEWRLRMGLGIELGAGFHGRQAVEGREGVLSIAQAATFGPHIDVALRAWF
jgi:hypothetical protein